MKEKLHLYSIMPLNLEHVDEICQDIYEQYINGVTTCALFSMTLVPEGNPVVDKAKILCDKYVVFKDKLDKMGVPSGVLVQASIGHGYKLSQKFPYQNVVTLNTGEETNTVCPFDKGFREYAFNMMATIAKTNPYHIMLDDDFRLIARMGKGCGCPLHMARFNELAGTNFTREEFWNTVSSDTVAVSEKIDHYNKIMIEVHRESLVQTAEIMRQGIDSVNPKIPGSFCCCGNNAEFAEDIAKIMAGKGNPTVLRINNGRYSKHDNLLLTHTFFRAATQIENVKNKVDVILAETDTCPQNRYSTSAMSLHTHFTGSILEGAQGAKHWITRLGAYEPESGTAYRKTLAKYKGFYQSLASVVKDLKWQGARITFPERYSSFFGKPESYYYGWSVYVLERLGLPVYFSSENNGVVCIEGEGVKLYSDEKIKQILSGKVVLASDSAKILQERGFGEYLGVEVFEWQGKYPSVEYIPLTKNRINVQLKVKGLKPLNDKVSVESTVCYSLNKQDYEDLFPAVTYYENELGGKVVVFSGTPVYEKFNHVEPYSFLNYSRKQQLINLFERLGELPACYLGDENVYFRTADMPNGDSFISLINLSFDPIENIELKIDRKVSKIEKLKANGERENVEFTFENGKYIVKTSAFVADPVILFVK